jgi:lysosomal acid lipase/cholesteryl ester hydrolase
MARNGFDVWLGNNRGTTFSRNHTYMDPDREKKFWEFSFVELGDFDAPA